MISPEFSTTATIIIFIVATVMGIWGILARNNSLRRISCSFAVIGFICQTLMLVLGMHKAGLSLGAYIQMLAWFLVLCGIAIWIKYRQDAILLFATPLCLILFALSEPFLQFFIHLPETLTGSFYTLHIGSLILSLALLLVAAVSCILFLSLQKRIKNKHIVKGMWQDVPALNILEKIATAATAVAFPLYTLGIVSGLFWAQPVFGSRISGDPKEIISIIVWLMFAILFYGRFVKSWKGRKPARLTIAIFLTSLLSIIVVNTFIDSHHSFNRL